MTTIAAKFPLVRELSVNNINDNSFINQSTGRRSVEIRIGLYNNRVLDSETSELNRRAFHTYKLTVPASDLIMGVARPTLVRADRFQRLLRERAKFSLAINPEEELFYIGIVQH